MDTWVVRKARTARFFGGLLVLAGFLGVALFVSVSLLPAADAAPVAGLVPQLPAAWVASAESWLEARRMAWLSAGLQGGAVLALLGIVVMALGAWIAGRQAPLLEAVRSRREDARRRVHQYRDGARS